MAVLKKQAIPPERLCIWKKRVQTDQKGEEFQELNMEAVLSQKATFLGGKYSVNPVGTQRHFLVKNKYCLGQSSFVKKAISLGYGGKTPL